MFNFTSIVVITACLLTHMVIRRILKQDKAMMTVANFGLWPRCLRGADLKVTVNAHRRMTDA